MKQFGVESVSATNFCTSACVVVVKRDLLSQLSCSCKDLINHKQSKESQENATEHAQRNWVLSGHLSWITCLIPLDQLANCHKDKFISVLWTVLHVHVDTTDSMNILVHLSGWGNSFDVPEIWNHSTMSDLFFICGFPQELTQNPTWRLYSIA